MEPKPAENPISPDIPREPAPVINAFRQFSNAFDTEKRILTAQQIASSPIRKAVSMAWLAYLFEGVCLCEKNNRLLPGYGSGFFDSTRLLLEKIPDIAATLDIPMPHEPIHLADLGINSKSPHFPPELYFIALRMTMRCGNDLTGSDLRDDLWNVHLSPSAPTLECAYLLINDSQALFKSIRKLECPLLPEKIKAFADTWNRFAAQLKEESTKYSSAWCPSPIIVSSKVSPFSYVSTLNPQLWELAESITSEMTLTEETAFKVMLLSRHYFDPMFKRLACKQ